MEVAYERSTAFDGVDTEVDSVLSTIRSAYNKPFLSASEVAESLGKQGFERKRDLGLWDNPDYRFSFQSEGLSIDVYEGCGNFGFIEGEKPFARVKIRNIDGTYLYEGDFLGL